MRTADTAYLIGQDIDSTALDRSVHTAYGWTDIPIQCEFLPEHEGEEDESASRPSRRRYRYRWPDWVHDEVLGSFLNETPRGKGESHD